MQVRNNRRNAVLLAALGLGLVTSQAQAATITWVGGAAGSWNVDANWSADSGTPVNRVPGSADTASIKDLTSTTAGAPGYQVTINSTTTVNILYVAAGIAAAGNGTLNIADGANLTVTTAFNLGTGSSNSRGYVNQSGGSVSAGSMTTGQSTGSREGYYNLSGGSFSITGTGNLTLGSFGNGFFTQTNGTVSIGGNIRLVTGVNNASTSTVTEASYVISGGSLTVTGNLVNGDYATSTGQGIGRAHFQVIGSGASSIAITGNYVTGSYNAVAPQRRDPTFDLRIDSGGVTKTDVTGTATLNGTLTMGVKGGVALTTGTTFRLLEAASISGDFAVKPNTSLWTVGIVNDVSGTRDAYEASLAAASLKGLISVPGDGSVADLAFTSSAAGYATLDALSTSSPVSLYLDVDPGTGKTTGDLVTYFTTNGLTAAADANGAYDLRLTFTPAATTSHFSFDLSAFNATATVAGIGAAQIVPEPTSLAVTVGMMVLLAKRRRADGR